MTRTNLPRPAVRAGTVFAVPFLLSVLLTGCSGGTTEDSAASGTPTRHSDDAKQAAVSACLRERGYDAPDPEGGKIGLSQPEGVDDDTYLRDLDDCVQRAGIDRSAGEDIPKRTDAEVRAFGRCVREHGIPDYPEDPASQDAYQPADPVALQRAVDACGGWTLGG